MRHLNHLGVRPDVDLGLFRDLMPDLARTYGVQFIGDNVRDQVDGLKKLIEDNTK